MTSLFGVTPTPDIVIATGSVAARSLADRFADVVNVKDYGAVGNGVTDDTAAIKSAIVAATGSILFFPEGIYLVSSELTIDQPMQIIGTTPHATNDNAVFEGSWLKLADSSSLTASEAILRLEHPGPSETNMRRFISIKDLGINGNKANNTNGNGIITETRNVLLDHLSIVLNADNGILAQDDASFGGSNSSLFHNLWVGYNGGNGLHLNRTSLSGDSHVIGGHYHHNDLSGVLCNQNNLELVGVSSWWNRDGFYLDPAQGSGISLSACHGYDNARAGTYLEGVIDFVSITSGHMNANNNATRATELSLTVADGEKAGIFADGACTNIVVSGVAFGFLSNSTGQKYGITAANASASFRIGAVDGGGAPANILNLGTPGSSYWHTEDTDAGLNHPGFIATGDVDLNANDILRARSLSFDSWESFTSISSNDLPATRSYVVLNVSGGATINTITWGGTDNGEQIVIIRNANATAVTITHNTSNLRLLSAADISLTQHRAIVFASVDGTIWQHVGGLTA